MECFCGYWQRFLHRVRVWYNSESRQGPHIHLLHLILFAIRGSDLGFQQPDKAESIDAKWNLIFMKLSA